MRFEVGDIVRVKKDHKMAYLNESYGDAEVISISDGRFPIRTKWEGDHGTGTWSEGSLRLVRRKDAI